MAFLTVSIKLITGIVAGKPASQGIDLASIGFGDLISREEAFDMESLFLRIKKMCKNIISGNGNEI